MSMNGAPEAQEGLTVQPQFVVDALQAQIQDLTQRLILSNAYIGQQQAHIVELSTQLEATQVQPGSQTEPEHSPLRSVAPD